jgi:hypothetical protein
MSTGIAVELTRPEKFLSSETRHKKAEKIEIDPVAEKTKSNEGIRQYYTSKIDNCS